MAALLSPKFVSSLTAIVLLIICLAYISAADTINRAAPTLFWVIIGIVGVIVVTAVVVFIVTQVERLQTLRAQMKSTREIAQAEAIKATAEAMQPQVITAPKGHQVVVASDRTDMTYTQLHLNPSQRVNGHYEAPTDLEIQTFMAYQGGGESGSSSSLVIDQQSVTSEPDLNILNQYSKDWLQSIVLPSPHVHLCGASGSGKTMLANHILVHIQKTCPGAEFYLLNPKHTAARRPFVIEPTYDDVEQAEEGLRRFIAIMEKRRHDPNFNQASNKIVFVIDEFDYIKDMKGKNITRLVNPLIKMGRELNIKVIIIGQSPLSDDTGLTQSSFYNMCRVAIWREGERLLKDNPMERKNKAPLVGQYEDLKAMAPQYEMETGKQLRYCLVTPLNGNPSVQVIPHLEDPVAAGQKRIAMPKPEPLAGSYDMKVCQAWFETSKNPSPTCNKMHKRVTGGDVSYNSRQKQNYIEILQKYGINPGFLERSI